MLFFRQGNTVIIKLSDQRDENEGLKEGGIGEGGCKKTIHCLSLPKKHVGLQFPCSCITELYEK
jgi:hypothetical protein